MFLYGMNIMADGLQKSAGGRMQKLMSFLTKNRLMAILVGAGITAIIQSSSATTVMVVGFVNAGMLELTQAVGVIMGANIGTTITAWIVSMSEWGSVMKPEFFSVCFISYIFILFAHTPSVNILSHSSPFAVTDIGFSDRRFTRCRFLHPLKITGLFFKKSSDRTSVLMS